MYSPLAQGLPNTEGWPWYAIFAISIILNLLMILKGPIQSILPRSTQQYFESRKSRQLQNYLQERGKDELVEELLLRFAGWILDDLTHQIKDIGDRSNEQNKYTAVTRHKGTDVGGPGLGRVINTLESQKDAGATEPDTANVPTVD